MKDDKFSVVRDRKEELLHCIDVLRQDLERQKFDLQNLKILLNSFFSEF